MPDLHFDETNDFEQNLEKFLEYMEADDAEMGALLRANIGALRGAFDDATRRDCRARFNESIALALNQPTEAGAEQV
jgi:hypothetical protein